MNITKTIALFPFLLLSAVFGGQQELDSVQVQTSSVQVATSALPSISKNFKDEADDVICYCKSR